MQLIENCIDNIFNFLNLKYCQVDESIFVIKVDLS